MWSQFNIIKLITRTSLNWTSSQKESIQSFQAPQIHAVKVICHDSEITKQPELDHYNTYMYSK